MNGIVPPHGIKGNAAKDTETILLTNGDRFSSDGVQMAADQVTARIAAAELSFEMDKVRRIVFRTDGRMEPAGRPADVRVRMHRSKFVMELDTMTESALVGSSECLGKVKLSRSVVRQVSFNIHGTHPVSLTRPPLQLEHVGWASRTVSTGRVQLFARPASRALLRPALNRLTAGR